MSFDEIHLIRMIIAVVAAALFVAASVIFLVYLERKVAGHVHRRPGPFEVGPHGMLQTVADAVKLLGKQPLKPDGADPVLFWLAPIKSGEVARVGPRQLIDIIYDIL